MPRHRRSGPPRARISPRLAAGLLCAGALSMTALGSTAQDTTAAETRSTAAGPAATAASTSDSTRRAPAASRGTSRPAPAPAAAVPATPSVPGLAPDQASNAKIIVEVGRSMGAGTRGEVIAVATSLQESRLHNLAVAVDHDSLGLFQQRPSTGWGSPSQILSPWHAARSFYARLLRDRSDWACLTCAAQRVQRSAFPSAYAKHEARAAAIVAALGG